MELSTLKGNLFLDPKVVVGKLAPLLLVNFLSFIDLLLFFPFQNLQSQLYHAYSAVLCNCKRLVKKESISLISFSIFYRKSQIFLMLVDESKRYSQGSKKMTQTTIIGQSFDLLNTLELDEFLPIIYIRSFESGEKRRPE